MRPSRPLIRPLGLAALLFAPVAAPFAVAASPAPEAGQGARLDAALHTPLQESARPAAPETLSPACLLFTALSATGTPKATTISQPPALDRACPAG